LAGFSKNQTNHLLVSTNQSNHWLVFSKSIQKLAGFQQINPIIGWFSTIEILKK